MDSGSRKTAVLSIDHMHGGGCTFFLPCVPGITATSHQYEAKIGALDLSTDAAG